MDRQTAQYCGRQATCSGSQQLTNGAGRDRAGVPACSCTGQTRPCNRENLEPKPARQSPGCVAQGASVHYQHAGTPAHAHPPQPHPGKHFLITGESCCPLCQLTAPPGSSPGNSTLHKAPSPSTAHGLQLLPAWLPTLKAEDAFLDNGPQEGPPREGL